MKILKIILVIVLLSSCNKSKHESKSYYIDNIEIKNAVSFKPGSYFIYRDSLSGMEDSIWVSSTISFLFDPMAQYNFIESDLFEIAYYKIQSYNKSLGAIGSGASKISNDYEISWQNKFTITKIPILYKTNWSKNDSIGELNNYSIFKNYYDSLELNGKYYSKIFEVYHKGIKYGTTDSVIAFKTFYNLSDGIVKYTDFSDSNYRSWELVRSEKIY